MSSLASEAHIHADIPLHAQSKSPAVLQKHAWRIRQLPLARHSCADPQGAVLRPCVSAQRLRAGCRKRWLSLLASI